MLLGELEGKTPVYLNPAFLTASFHLFLHYSKQQVLILLSGKSQALRTYHFLLSYLAIAQILSSRSTANADDKALFASLNTSIPAIAPRGSPNGNGSFTGVVYNGVADSACWWTWKGCTVPKLAGLQADITRCAEPNTWGFTVRLLISLDLRKSSSRLQCLEGMMKLERAECRRNGDPELPDLRS